MLINFNNNLLQLNNSVSKANTQNKYPNLAPLSKDTVSFSGSAILHAENMSDAPSEKFCRQVKTNAEPARFYLEKVLDTYLKVYTKSTLNANSKKYPVLRYSTRTKSPVSIREKVVSKYAKIVTGEYNNFADISVEEIAKYFPFLEDKTIQDAYKSAHQTMDNLAVGSIPNSRKTPPFSNSSYFLNEIIQQLNNDNIINLDEIEESKLENIFSNIVEKIDEKAPKDSNRQTYIEPTSINGIKYYANDIVGARIVLRDASSDCTDIVIDALKSAVDDGVLKIKSIENNVPKISKLPIDKTVNDFTYASSSKLKSLAEMSGAELVQRETPSGYMAIHINLDLSNDMFSSYHGAFNGYTGEIQIIGPNVEKLKEVEDLCYKFKDNKNAINASYKPFRDYFKTYYSEANKKAFNDYTYDLYLAQRLQPAGSKQRGQFPSLKSLGYEDKLPKELDFNNLQKLKNSCDVQNEYLQKVQEKEAEKNQDPMKSLRTEGNIKTLKSLITYYFG